MSPINDQWKSEDDQWMAERGQWLPRTTTADMGLSIGVEANVGNVSQASASSDVAMQSDIGISGNTTLDLDGSVDFGISSNMSESVVATADVDIAIGSLDMELANHAFVHQAELPPGRTWKVKFQNRTLTVTQDEDKTL